MDNDQRHNQLQFEAEAHLEPSNLGDFELFEVAMSIKNDLILNDFQKIMELQYLQDRGMGMYVNNTPKINQFRIGMAGLILIYSDSKFVVIC